MPFRIHTSLQMLRTASGTTRTSQRACRMSASGGKAENIYS
jgi:hypothetical protein